MVNFVIRHDKKDRFRFAALQSSAGSYIRNTKNIPDEVDSFIYIENGKAYLYSTAALMVLKRMGWPWAIAAAFLIVPAFLRNAIYKWIAKNRYMWFGKRDSCMIPTPEIRKKFLM
jgi:predicted DCC family thiol-disulfide oxidoreductase YuxK